MRHEHFDNLARFLGGGATRRGVLGGVAGAAGLHLTGSAAKRRKRTRSQSAKGTQDTQCPSLDLINTTPECFACPPTGITLLSAYYPGYWWDHTELTVAVQAPPNADPALVCAVRAAITTWNEILEAAFGGLITVTDVTGKVRNAHKADIVLHYVPHAGGVNFAGYALCGDHKCPNVIVSSDPPRPLDQDQYSPTYLGQIALHELGHALGLGHAEPLVCTNDLMGYGWPPLEPVLSQCDLDGLAKVFEWALNGEAPHPPTDDFVPCGGCTPTPSPDPEICPDWPSCNPE